MKAAHLVLDPSGVEGGETHLHWVRGDNSLCAGVPLGGACTTGDWDKIEALINIKTSDDRFAWVTEILFDARDKTTKVAFLMKKLPGVQLTQILIPAERERLGLDWGLTALATLATLVTDLFAYTERFSITQNDGHTGQYLVSWNAKSMLPEKVCRVDARAFGFPHAGKVYGPAKVLPETLPPELQGKDITKTPPTREADRFMLAVLVFHILTGGAPWEYAGDDEEPCERVRKKLFALLSSPKSAKVPDEIEAAFLALPVDFIVLFERAFLGTPDKRPTPIEWKRALKNVSRPAFRSRGRWRVWSLVRPAIKRAVANALPYGRRYRWFGLAVAAVVLTWLALPVATKQPTPTGAPGGGPSTVNVTTTGAPGPAAPLRNDGTGEDAGEPDSRGGRTAVSVRAHTATTPAGQGPPASAPNLGRKANDQNAWKTLR